MNKKNVLFSLLISLTLLSGCLITDPLSGNGNDGQEIPESEIEAYTSDLVSQGFEFCPGSYLDLEVIQIHENPQFNFYNQVSALGKLEFDIIKNIKLETSGEIPLAGEGWAGVCQFTSSGSVVLKLQGRLIPGENNQPALLIYGDCQSSVTSKPPCGDFGMIPLEKNVLFTIPYQDGGSFEQEWSNQSAGVSGTSIWTLHIPCQN